MKSKIVSCLMALCMAVGYAGNAAAQQTIVPDKPTMGWSSWNTYGVGISEAIIKKQATAMKNKGLLAVGYNHINIDDGYFGGRDAETGQLLIHPDRFPHGLEPVIKHIHDLGMKAGIYSDGGYNTCGSNFNGDVTGIGVGLYGHDQQDCDYFFKELGFDFIKVDFCGGSYYHNKDHLVLDEEERYTAIAKAIAKTGRTDVRLNICRWAYPGNWAHDIATSWRTTGDISDTWESIKGIIHENLYLSAYCYDGHYNDMDMLEVGRRLTTEEDKTHFGMWCIMSSPLLIGCDMSKLSVTKPTLALLKNKELIALNQDDLCLQAYVVQHVGDTYVLVKDIQTLYGTTRAVALYNSSDEEVEMSVPFTTLDLDGTVQVRNLFTKKDEGEMTGELTVTVPAHGTRIYRLTAEKRLERNIYEAETAYLGKYSEIKGEVGKYEDKACCSGGAYATWLGNGAENDLQWRHVYSENGGAYTMKLSYVSAENRSMTVAVNGKDVKTLSACNSGSWDKVGTRTVNITLQPGENTIRLYNKSGWMPNVDGMTLQPQNAGAGERIVVGVKAPYVPSANKTGKEKFYSLDGRLVKHPRKGGIYIYEGKKILY